MTAHMAVVKKMALEHTSDPAIGHFDSTALSFSQQYGEKACFRDRRKLFVDIVRSTTVLPARVLDFGCGPGIIALSLAELGYEVFGVDGASGMVEMARARQAELRLKNAEFKMAKATEWEPEDDSFDVVVCSSVIEYLQKDAALVTKLVSSLKRGGTLLISVPQTPSLGSFVEDTIRFKRRMLHFERSLHLSLHLRRYRRGAFAERLRMAGIEDIRCTTFELPCLGKIGVKLSRLKWLGIMALFWGRKE